MKMILCPTDGTEQSHHAVAVAAEWAAKFGAELLLCTVNIAHGGGRGMLIYHWTDDEAQKILSEAVAVAKQHGTTPSETAVVVHRDPGMGVIAFAESKSVDHIVMGTGDRRGLSRLMLGSVATDVAGRAHCPVTVVR